MQYTVIFKVVTNENERVPTIYIWSKNKKKYQKFSAENFQFFKLKKSLFIAWASFRNDT